MGIDVRHPRALMPPFGGMYLAPGALYRSGLAVAWELCAGGWDFDLIDAHYLYPDGVAAARIADALGKPFIVTARGTDINVLMDIPRPRRLILESLKSAAAIIVVAESLKTRLAGHGIAADRVTVLRNGVDFSMFSIAENVNLQEAPAGDGPLLLSVGNLVNSKGVDLTISSVSKIEDARLIIVGDGPERRRLEAQALALGISHRVAFAGNVLHADLPRFYQAADLLVFPTEREGSPNVVLESLACGTPIVASRIAATEELLSGIPGARLVERTPGAIAGGICELMATPPDPAGIREYARRFDWKETSTGLKRLMSDVAGSARRG